MKTVKWTLCLTMICAATFALQTSAFAADTDALVVTETGHVGIGLDDPQYPLDVKGNIHAGGLLLGTYPRHSDYTVFGSSSFDQTQIGNYALLQHNITGRTFLNSPSDIRFRIKNVDKMVLSGEGNVGIGTTNPQSLLHIAKDANASATLGQAPAVLILEQANNTNWSGGQAGAEIIFKKGDDIVGAIRSEHMRAGGPHSYEDAGLSFYVAPAGESPTPFEAMRVDHTGKVGIGTTNPQDKLDVDGYVRANGTRLTSDARWKENIEPIGNALNLVTQLRGVSYNWVDSSRGQGQQIGVVAQEVEEIFPEVVHTDSQGYKSVEYSKLVAPLIESIKALKAENDSLKAALEMVERRLDQLER